MSLQQEEYLHQQALHARCVHPNGKWEEFPRSAFAGSIVTRFMEMVARYPERLAVKSRNQALTYAQLNGAANAVAQQLLAALPSGQQPIMLCCQHDVPALVAALGVLKTGNFYVCLDAHSPLAVNQQVVDEVKPTYLLTDQATQASAAQLVQPGLPLCNVEQLDWHTTTNVVPPCGATPTDLAYITFTSGSTGQPKGVMEDQQDVLYYSSLFINYFHLCPEDRTLTVTRISTGGAWVSIYPALFSGGSVFLFDVQQAGTAALAAWISTEQITLMAMAVSIFRLLAPQLPPKSQLEQLRMLGLGGEPIYPSDIQLYQRHCPDHTLLRFAFGCTEAHFISCYFMDKASPLLDGPTPVGYATDDAEILILDEAGCPMAAGEIGEIAVSRTYLTVGYWNNPTLTAARYAANPNQRSKRIYRLGDRGYQRADGCLVHLGRLDTGVKIRGHLIDLDHVERILSQLDGVEQAAALAIQNENGQTTLLAYLKVEPTNQATVSFFYQRLVNQLPGYLLPHAIVLVDQMPITASGKIDRRALPKPGTQRPPLVTPYRAPHTPLEEQLVALWHTVLPIHPIGVDDHFLELGGDSLRAMMVVNRLQELTSTFIYVRHLFEAPTIATFSRFLMQHHLEVVQRLTGAADYQSLVRRGEQMQSPQRLDETTIKQIRTWLSTFRRQIPAASDGSLQQCTKNPTAIFVLSAPRSGSTLFRILLAGHPQLFAPPEMALLSFHTLGGRQVALSEPGAGEREGALRAIMAAQNCDGATAQTLMQQLEAENLTTQAFYRQLQSWIAPRLLVDKTPNYAYTLETLRQAEVEFDEPRYLHLVRHPYGMIHSYVEDKTALRLLARLRHQSPELALPALNQEYPVAPAVIAEAIWLIVQQNLAAFFATVPPHRRLLVHFEELVRQPVLTLERVCTFLDIPFHPAMVQPYADPLTRMTDGVNALSLMVGDIKFKQHQQIDPAVAERWRTYYTTDFLSDQTWAVAENLGYQRPDLPLDTAKRSASLRQTTDDDLEELITALENMSEAEAEQKIYKKQVEKVL